MVSSSKPVQVGRDTARLEPDRARRFPPWGRPGLRVGQESAGAKGATGATGATGPAGPAGATGPAPGAAGAQGPKGDTGSQGLKGDTGPQGPIGPSDGYVATGNDQTDVTATLTGLPAGSYVISASLWAGNFDTAAPAGFYCDLYSSGHVPRRGDLRPAGRARDRPVGSGVDVALRGGRGRCRRPAHAEVREPVRRLDPDVPAVSDGGQGRHADRAVRDQGRRGHLVPAAPFRFTASA